MTIYYRCNNGGHKFAVRTKTMIKRGISCPRCDTKILKKISKEEYASMDGVKTV